MKVCFRIERPVQSFLVVGVLIIRITENTGKKGVVTNA